MAEVAVVVPTCRGFKLPAQTIPVDWIIVHDRQEWEITSDYNLWTDPSEARQVVGGSSIRDERGNRRDLVPPRFRQSIVAPAHYLYGHGTSAIRQAGLDWCASAAYPYVLTLDDDCIVGEDWAESHVRALRGSVPVSNNTVPGYIIRGNTLDHSLPVGISHGLWSGVLDYPAWYQLDITPDRVELEDRGWNKIPAPFPMCGMNVGFRREVLPAVYFQHTFRRHDDIFAGWMAQRVCELHGFGFVNGGAVVQHERASNAEKNFELEKPGDAVAKRLLDHIRGFSSTWADMRGTYLLLARHLGSLSFEDRELNTLYKSMVRSMNEWTKRRSE